MTKRIFLVGCARSGTTLFQSMLAAHPQVCSFPETQFFTVLLGGLQERMLADVKAGDGWFKRVLKASRLYAGVALPRHEMAKQRLQMLCAMMEMDDYFDRLQLSPLSIRIYANALVSILDEYSGKAGVDCWVEKSPNHLYFINEIERYVEGANFLHIMRNGADVVASICDAADKNSQGNDFSGDIDVNIQRWISSFKVSERYRGKSNHFILKYDDLVSNPHDKLQEVCEFIGIDYLAEMISMRTDTAKSLIRDNESWKSGVSGDIQGDRPSKFNSVFTSAQQEYIRMRLKRYDASMF